MVEDFFTVSSLNNLIKDVIQAGFPRMVWVCGEIQQFNRNRTKRHVFFELVEKDSASQDIKARIGLVIFAGKKVYIEKKFKEVDQAFNLKDDIEVKFACRVDFYAPHGAVRLIVEDIDPAYTLGKLAQEKQRLIIVLKKQGVFEQNKKRELPLAPLNIGLITAYDSAAYNDFISELDRSGYSFKVRVRNTLMQGKNSEKDVCQALCVLEGIKNLDLIVITRGGGSLAELSCFDSKLIAQAIAKSRLPVFSGIGHEINLTITDMAAHTYAKTPTAIAQFLIEKIDLFLQKMDTYQNGLLENIKTMFQGRRASLQQDAWQLYNQTGGYLKEHKNRLMFFGECVRHKPLVRMQQGLRDLLVKRQAIRKEVKHFFSQSHHKLRSFEKIVDFVHPRNTIKRGFCVVQNQKGEYIKSIQQLKENERVINRFFDGCSHNIVEKIVKED